MNGIESRTINGFTVTLYHDDSPVSPREWTHGCEMAMAHRSYDLPNDAGIDLGTYATWSVQEASDYLYSDEGESAYLVVPVYMIDHSGIAFRAGRDFGDVDPGSWDSGLVGFAYVTPQNWAETQGRPWTGSEEDWGLALKLITEDVAVYSQWAEGDVYGYVITDPVDGEHLDSCWGFYGADSAWEEAGGVAQSMEHEG